MKKDYINSIVYNKYSDGKIIYYVVKAFDGQTLRVEQLKTQPKDDIGEAISLQEFYNNDRVNIVYYSYGQYDVSVGG